jgi:hypothetical protein
MLTAHDLAPYRDAMVAVRTLRRQWLSGRSQPPSSPAVFVDGVLAPGVNALVQYPGNRIREIRFLPGIEASIRFGSEYAGGAILVETAR